MARDSRRSRGRSGLPSLIVGGAVPLCRSPPDQPAHAECQKKPRSQPQTATISAIDSRRPLQQRGRGSPQPFGTDGKEPRAPHAAQSRGSRPRDHSGVVQLRWNGTMSSGSAPPLVFDPALPAPLDSLLSEVPMKRTAFLIFFSSLFAL